MYDTDHSYAPDDCFNPYKAFRSLFGDGLEAVRRFMETDVVYRSISIEYVIQHLQPEDVVTVRLERKGYPEHTLRVTGHRGEFVEVEAVDGGDEYHLWARSFNKANPTHDGFPWLRTTTEESVGVADRIVIHELA
jgi:hypothetical protein